MSKYASRKFIMAVAGAVILILNAVLEARSLPAINQDTVLALVALILGYIGVQGTVDYQAAKSPAPTNLAQFAEALQPAQYAANYQQYAGRQMGTSAVHPCRTGAKPSED